MTDLQASTLNEVDLNGESTVDAINEAISELEGSKKKKKEEAKKKLKAQAEKRKKHDKKKLEKSRRHLNDSRLRA